MSINKTDYIVRRFQAWGGTKPVNLWQEFSPDRAQNFIDKYNEEQNVGCSVMMFPPGTTQADAKEAPVWTNVLVFDIDDMANLDNARSAATKLDTWLITHLGINEGRIRRFFSGAAGFHIEVDIDVFKDFAPNSRLNEQLEWMRNKAREYLGEKGSTIDKRFEDKTRIIRFPNSINHKTGLRKIFLSKFEFDDTIDVFQMLAKGKRPVN